MSKCLKYTSPLAWSHDLWLGATKVGSEWKWDNGDSLDMSKFQDGRPNNSGPCLMMSESFVWYDNVCGPNFRRHVCEK